MGKPATIAYLPAGIHQQLLDFENEGLLDSQEREEASVALLQRLTTPVNLHNFRIGNKNAPPLVKQRGL